MLAVVLASPFLGLDNFGVAVAIGLRGAAWRTHVSVAVLFGSMATAAILLGSGLGAASAGWLGPFGQYAGGAILIGLGLYQITHQHADSSCSPQHADSSCSPGVPSSAWSILGVGLGVSLDTAVAGVAFGMRGDPILASAAVVGVVTGLMSAAGLALGSHVGRWSGRVSPQLAPGALIAVGLGVATGLL